MRKRFILIIIFLTLLAIRSAYAADTYIIDPGHSTIGFAVMHMEVSVTRGEFTEYHGEIVFDEKDISKLRGEIVIETKSINTRLEARDKHLRNEDFFDVEKYPTIVFRGTKFLKTDTGYVFIGDLTMHGVTREVSGPAKIRGPVTTSFGTEIIGISGETTINRYDYGMTWNAGMPGGEFAVAKEVKILIDVEASRTLEDPKAEDEEKK